MYNSFENHKFLFRSNDCNVNKYTYMIYEECNNYIVSVLKNCIITIDERITIS